MQRVLDLLRADIMDVAVKAARGQDAPFACDHLGAGADDDVDTRLRVGVACLADRLDAAIPQADIRLVDPGPIKDQRIGNDGIHSPRGAGCLRLPHAVTDHLAPAEFHFLPIGTGEVALHLNDQIGIGQPHTVSGGGAIHGGIIGAGDFGGHVGSILLFNLYFSCQCTAGYWVFCISCIWEGCDV